MDTRENITIEEGNEKGQASFAVTQTFPQICYLQTANMNMSSMSN